MDRILKIALFSAALWSLSGCDFVSQPDGDDDSVLQSSANTCAVKISDCDFSRDKVWQVVDPSGDTVALLTLEYIGKAFGKQAVLVYTRGADCRWRTDSVFVASVTLEQSGTTYRPPMECCSGGTLKYYPADDAWFYNDITKAVEDDFDTVFIKKETDGSTQLKHNAVTEDVANLIPLRLSLGGYEYPVVKVAGFLWTAENVRSAIFPSGEMIPQSGSWSSRSALFGYSANDRAGCLYNHYAALQLAPQGWHLPSGGSAGEWAVLTSFVDGASDLKKSGTDITGFSIVPAGRITSSGSRYEPDDDDCIFWSSTIASETKACFTKVYHKTVGNNVQYTSSTDMRSGFAVRLIKSF